MFQCHISFQGGYLPRQFHWNTEMFGNSTVPSLFSKIQQYQPTLQELIENKIDHEYLSHGIPFSLAGTQFPVEIMKTQAKKRREVKQWLGT